MADFDVMTGRWPLAQRVTSPHKVPTWLLPDKVVKGPYPADSVVPRLVVARHALHAALGNPCVLRPRIRGEYVVYRYVGEPVALDGPVLEADYQWRGVATRVLDRAAFPTVQASRHDDLDGIAGRVLFHLAVCYALGSGDVGLWNILVHPASDRVVGIDMEDFRMHVPEPPDTLLRALFTRPPARKHAAALNTYIAHRAEELAGKLQAALAAAQDLHTTAPVLRVSPETIQQRLRTLLQLVAPAHVPPPPVDLPAALPVAPTSRPPTDLTVQAASAAPRRGPSVLTARSPCGHGFFDLASALQKCVRRGDTDVAVSVLADGLAAGPPISTGLANRLRVIALEDVGIANLELAVSVVAAVNRGDATPGQLVWAVRQLCASRKTRVLSLLFNAYCTPAGVAHMGSPALTDADTLGALLDRKDARAVAAAHHRINFARMAAGEAFFDSLAPRLHADTLQVLKAAYRTRKASRDVRVFYLTPLLACLYVPDVRGVAPRALPSEPVPRVETLQLPEYVYDMHTAAGRGRKRPRQHFAQHSCVLANEWNPPEVDAEALKATYLHVKQCADADALNKT